MDVNGFKIVGIVNITTSEHVTSPQDVGMTSSGSPMAPQEICILILAFLMLVIWKGKHAILTIGTCSLFSICKTVSVMKMRCT